jgi:hypothetical protein
MAMALNSSLLREDDEVQREVFSAMLENINSNATSEPFTEPEFGNYFTQISIGRPHWDEEQAFNQWRIPEFTNRIKWHVWCQFPRKEIRDQQEAAKTLDEKIALEQAAQLPLRVEHVKAAITINELKSTLDIDARVDVVSNRDKLDRAVMLLSEDIGIKSIIDDRGRTLTWEQHRGRLFVILPKPLDKGDRMSLFIYAFDQPQRVFEDAKSLSTVNWMPDTGYLNFKTSDLFIHVKSRLWALGTGNLVSLSLG